MKPGWDTNLLSGLTSLLATGKYSDLTIYCRGSIFKAHRAIICSQSTFFDLACQGKFKEAATGEIELPDDDPVLIEKLVGYFYTGTYLEGNDTERWEDINSKKAKLPEKPRALDTRQKNKKGRRTHHWMEVQEEIPIPSNDGTELSGPPPKSAVPRLEDMSSEDLEYYLRYTSFTVNIEMYAIADKYGIPILKEFALEKFQKCLDQDWWDVQSFCSATRRSYELPSFVSLKMRELIVAHAVANRKMLNKVDEFQVLLLQVSDFTHDVLLRNWDETDKANAQRTDQMGYTNY
ncbi:MAG: hypothetical protein M1819_006808 [Sarea resinae]|nr:MAG: hypothetical protein M1819_006808 [Sarea resinae]